MPAQGVFVLLSVMRSMPYWYQHVATLLPDLKVPGRVAEGDCAAQGPHSLPNSCLSGDGAGLRAGRLSLASPCTCSPPGAWTSSVRKGVQRGCEQAVRHWLEIRAQTVMTL